MNLFAPIKKLLGMRSDETMLGTSDALQALQDHRLPPSRDKAGILEAYKEVPILRMCVSKIAHSVADTQWQVIPETQTEPDPDHPALEIFEKPNSRQSGYIFTMITQAYLDLVGEAIWLTLPSDFNATGFEFLPIPPTKATQTQDDQGNTVWDVKLGSDFVTLDDELVTALTMPDLTNLYGRGHGMGQTLADEIQVDEYAAKHISSTFHNHARPDMMVFMPGVREKQFKKIKEKWYEEYGGPQNSGKIMFSGSNEAEAEMSAVEMSRSLGDSEAAATRTMQEEKVRKGFGIPPEILGDSKDSNRATIEAAEVIYNKNAVKPRLSLLISELNLKVMPMIQTARSGEFAFPNPVPDDKELTRKLMKQHPGSFEKNEVRRMAGQEAKDELDGEMARPKAPAPSNGGGPPAEEEPKSKEMDFDLYTKGQQEQDAQQVAEEAIQGGGAATGEVVAASTLATEEAASALIGELGSDADDVDLGNLKPGIEEAVDERINEIWKGKIDQNTKERVKDTLMDGFEDGKNPREIKQDLAESFEDMKSSRAETIAQNEMGAASSRGKQEVMDDAKSVQKKSWLHPWGLKPAARKQHEFMENRTRKEPIPVNQDFTMSDGTSGQGPHMMNDPSHDVWCHCASLPVTDQERHMEMTDHDRQEKWQKYKDQVDEKADEFEPVVAQYFEAQKQNALEAFDQIISHKV